MINMLMSKSMNTSKEIRIKITRFRNWDRETIYK